MGGMAGGEGYRGALNETLSIGSGICYLVPGWWSYLERLRGDAALLEEVHH